jgi:ubiquinone/menaquinone biosynthesis C-methylase UbiE
MIKNLFCEMLRVTKKGGAVCIITNGIPLKRMDDFESFAKLMPEV